MGPREIASLGPREAANFILDVVGALEAEGRSGSYIANCVKPLKSWLSFNGVEVQQRIKIPHRDELVRFGDERPPTPEELRRILSVADLRARVACSLIAYSGLRIEVLGNYLGTDGLEIRDFPEVFVEDSGVRFEKVPTMIVVRKNLSKAGHRFITFLCAEGCNYLKEYLEWRMRMGEGLSERSPIITPSRAGLAGKHIRTINIGDLIRRPIREAGYSWRPYVLRRYFDTRMMQAESEGIIIRDWRVFWMGHKGDIEHTYTVNKGLPEDVIENMREAYKRCEPFLSTAAQPLEQASIVKEAKIEALKSIARSLLGIDLLEVKVAKEKEVGRELSKDEELELFENELKKLREGRHNPQRIVHEGELESYLSEGWQFVSVLPSQRILVRKAGEA